MARVDPSALGAARGSCGSRAPSDAERLGLGSARPAGPTDRRRRTPAGAPRGATGGGGAGHRPPSSRRLGYRSPGRRWRRWGRRGGGGGRGPVVRLAGLGGGDADGRRAALGPGPRATHAPADRPRLATCTRPCPTAPSRDRPQRGSPSPMLVARTGPRHLDQPSYSLPPAENLSRVPKHGPTHTHTFNTQKQHTDPLPQALPRHTRLPRPHINLYVHTHTHTHTTTPQTHTHSLPDLPTISQTQSMYLFHTHTLTLAYNPPPTLVHGGRDTPTLHTLEHSDTHTPQSPTHTLQTAKCTQGSHVQRSPHAVA